MPAINLSEAEVLYLTEILNLIRQKGLSTDFHDEASFSRSILEKLKSTWARNVKEDWGC